jgi:hypothetical protein
LLVLIVSWRVCGSSTITPIATPPSSGIGSILIIAASSVVQMPRRLSAPPHQFDNPPPLHR